MRSKPVPLKRVAAPLRQQALERLRRSCIDGVYQPGERLTETTLCDDLGVSRTVVRETLRQLESEGLVEIVPNVGAVVRKVSPEEVGDLYEVRGVLESLIAKQCAIRATTEELDLLERCMEALNNQSRSKPDDIGALLELKDRFMTAMVEGSKNRVAGEMLGNIHARVSSFRAITLTAPGRIQHTIEELADLVAAIVDRDADRAADLAYVHVSKAAEIALS